MDDARIRDLTAEVMAAIGTDTRADESLESRVSALETEVARLKVPAATASTPAAAPRGHISLTVLDVPSGGDRCILEPDRPCTNSGTCRTLGH